MPPPGWAEHPLLDSRKAGPGRAASPFWSTKWRDLESVRCGERRAGRREQRGVALSPGCTPRPQPCQACPRPRPAVIPQTAPCGGVVQVGLHGAPGAPCRVYGGHKGHGPNPLQHISCPSVSGDRPQLMLQICPTEPSRGHSRGLASVVTRLTQEGPMRRPRAHASVV